MASRVVGRRRQQVGLATEPGRDVLSQALSNSSYGARTCTQLIDGTASDACLQKNSIRTTVEAVAMQGRLPSRRV
jgi:hypothetical protein